MSGSPVPERLAAALSDRYRIERELGAGGMATVYLAEDLKHDRKVAIKVLKPELTAVLGGDRFIQEIKTTASLQHPHILPLFDSGTVEGFLFYVMPYIEGETLRDKLHRETQLGVEEAVRIAREVADALDYAHRQGIIHRDIKPENILLHNGRPMVADFGIALAVSAAAGGRMTETGTSIGTPHYMAPEQATGDKQITGRADIYALASVLYELLAGEPPHTGSSAQAVIMKIIADTPRPVTELRKSVPPNVAAAVMVALEKLPADRFESAKAFADALADPGFRHSADPMDMAASRRAAVGRRWIAGVGWGVAALLAAVLVWPGPGAAPDSGAPRYAFDVADAGLGSPVLAFAENGALVYAPGRTIYRRHPDSTTHVVLHADTRSIANIATSPDGRSVAFSTFGDNQEGLYRMPAAGGPVQTLYDGLLESAGLIWARDGWIYFRRDTTLVRVPEAGGALDTVRTSVGPFRLEAPLPTGALLLSYRTGIAALDPASGDTTTLLETGYRPSARWSPTGHLVHSDPSGAVVAVPYDLTRLRATGEPRRLLADMATSAPDFAISENGALLYTAGSPGVPRWGRSDFAWMAMDGTTERIPIETIDGHTDGTLSPDFTRIAYIRAGRVHVFDLDVGSDVDIGEGNHNPIWSPDGTEIAVRDDDRDAVVVLAADGSGSRVVADLAATSPNDWTADGTILANSFARDLYAIRDGPGPSARPLLAATWDEQGPVVSPDGRWMAYSSSEDGVQRGYLRTWPDLSGKALVTGVDTISPDPPSLYWSADARTLFYERSNDDVVAVTIGADGTASQPRVLFSVRGGQIWDVDHPRNRFLVRMSAVGADRPDGLPEPLRIVVITNLLYGSR